MSEFRIVKRADMPKMRGRRIVHQPRARLHKSGQLYLNAAAAKTLGTEDCLCLLEFDEESLILKITAVDQPPRGISEEDLFQVRIRIMKNFKQPMGRLYILSLLRYIGYSVKPGQSLKFPVTAVDPRNRSISLNVPAEQLSCDDSSN